MRVVIVVPSLLNKAPVIVARDLADGLMRRNIDVTVYYLDDKRELEFPCEVKRLCFRSWVDLQSFDIIHSHMLRPDLLIGFQRSIGLLRKPCVTTIHNILEQDLEYTYGRTISTVAAFFWRAAWSTFSARIVVSEYAKKYYEKYQPHLVFTTIKNGRSLYGSDKIASSDEKLIADLRANYNILGSFANVSNVKGLDQVVKALSHLKDCAFLIIGDGPALPALLGLAADLGVEDRVLAIGYRPNARAYLRYVDCYLMPSRSEGMPLALIEAGLARRPIVCSDIPALRAMYSDDEVAFFALDSINALVDAIQLVLNNVDRYGSASFKKTFENYSAEQMVEKYLTVYLRLCEGIVIKDSGE